MRRILARLGLVGLLAGVPALLLALGNGPRIPRFSGSLTDTYLPLDGILEVLALVIWVLWLYVAVVSILRAIALITARGGDSGALLGATSLVTPGPLRHLIDFAIGGALVAATLSVNTGSSNAVAPRPVAAVAEGVAIRDAAPNHAISRPATQTYRVRSGDSLWRIAERELGSGYEWRKIFDLNRGKTFSDGRSLTHPRLIYPGWTIELPAKKPYAHPKAPAGIDRASASRNGNGQSVALNPSTIGPATPAPSGSISAAPGNGSRPTAVQKESRHRAEPVLRLPSGALVAASFASGLLTAELLGRLRRRRRWHFSSTEPELPRLVEDPPLVRELRHAGGATNSDKVSAALGAVGQAWQTSTGLWPRIHLVVEERDRAFVICEDTEGRPLPKPSGGSIGPSVGFSRAGSVVTAEVRGPFPVQRRQTTALQLGLAAPLGRTRDGSALHVSALGIGGMAATGARANDLIRQYIVALAASAPPQELQVIVLGAEGLGLNALPQLRGSYTWDVAEGVLRDLQEEFMARARLLLDESTPDIWAYLGTRSDELPPALAIVSGVPPAALKPIVEAIGRQAPSLGSVLLAIGWNPEGFGVHVVADDSPKLEIDLPHPTLTQLFFLDDTAALQAIDVIREAWPQADSEAEVNTEVVGDRQPDDETSATTEQQIHECVTTDEEPTSDNLVVPEPPTPPSLAASEPEPNADPVSVRCLGTFEVTRGARTLGKGWRKKSKEILAYLIAHSDGASKDQIVDAIWPEAGPDAEAAFLRRVSELRQYVRSRTDSNVFVERNGETYRLEQGAWFIDAKEMESCIREATHCPDPDRAEEMLRRAIEMYRGEFCADCYYSWLEPVRERYRVLFLRGLALLADCLEAKGEHEEALTVVDRAITIDPLSEDLWRRAMKIEMARGRRAVALRRYHQLEAILEREIEVDPDPQTQALAQSLEGAR